MKTKSKDPIDKSLREEVLAVVDQLYGEEYLWNKTDNMIALQIVKSISYDYAVMNCGLHFIFEEQVIPYLKKMHENQRLEKVKELLTNGFIDIDKERIYLRNLPYLNYDEERDRKIHAYITEIPNNEQVNL